MSQRDRKPMRRIAAVLALACAVLAATEARAVNVEDRSGYNSEYIFALTKGVVDSTMATPLKPILFLLTVPMDLVLLPIAAIGGFFG